VPVRRELAVRTIFNLLGPLTNPAGAERQLIGVADAVQMELVAGARSQLGVQRALVVSGDDGLDEISIAAATKVLEVNGPEISSYELLAADVGVTGCDDAVFAAECAGGTPEYNAAVCRAILGAGEGEAAGGASVELAVINAGAAIYRP